MDFILYSIMDKDLFKNLKDLQQIKPNDEYSKQSRLLILSSWRQEKQIQEAGFWPLLLSGFKKPAFVVALSGFFILIIFLGVSYFSQILSPLFLPGSNQNNLVAEANEMTALIQVRLDEVKYNIQELEDKKLADLATLNDLRGLLTEATKDLTEAAQLDAEGEDLEISLQKMKAAYEILQKMSLEINNILTK